MSFTLQLTPDLVSVEPGASVPVSITVQNRGGARERYEMEIEGVDPEWKAVPVPVFEADAGENRSERFFFKPPRASESVAGDYPFVVRVRSLESGESQIVQGVLQVKAFHHLSMEVSPKRGVVSPARRHCNFEVTIVNLGNSEHTVRLLAGDAEEECAYELESDQVTVGPGAQRQVEMTVSPKSNPWFTSGRLVGISISARSVDTPSVVSTSQAQLERRPLLSVATLAAAVVVAIVFLAWFLARPKPIKVEVYSDHQTVEAGQPVTINWLVQGASHILIKTPTDSIYGGTEMSGHASYTPSTEGQLEIDATATQDGGDEKTTKLFINVIAPPQVEKPVILNLFTKEKSIQNGQSFVLNYKFSASVTKATLAPDNKDLNLSLSEMQVTPTHVGRNDYTVVALNSKGEQTQQDFSVNVYDKPDATILWFEASPKEATPDAPKITLSWQVTGAALVTLQVNNDPPVQVAATDKQDFAITGKTVFKITGIDTQKREAVQTVIVPYTQPKMIPNQPVGSTSGDPANPSTTTGTPPPSSTTSGATGSTTGGRR